jgi:hypothetical protein
MNRARGTLVEPMICHRFARLSLVLGCLAAGCVDINGGAVEVRWEIRQADGDQTSCGDTKVAEVVLCARPVEGGPATCRYWPCTEYQGTTAFSIEPGRYALSIAPRCATGIPNANVPAPILRDITNGNVTELNTLLIEAYPDQPIICPEQME